MELRRPAAGGLLVVLSGPSGTGKGSIRRGLRKIRPDIIYGVSVTTRKPRAGEVDGESYFFVDEEEFFRKVRAGELVEWAKVYDNYYGTPREPMESQLAAGQDIILEKDIQGALALKERYPEAVYVFILPPSFEELRRRVERRGTESAEERVRRMASASWELRHIGRYDYVIVNDNLEKAVRQLVAVIEAEKCRVGRHPGLFS